MMQERLNWLPWKGSGVVRRPRVRIPLIPPAMCEKCLKRAIGREILDIESKLNRLFKKVEAEPNKFKHDAEFISLLDCMGNLLDKYKEI